MIPIAYALQYQTLPLTEESKSVEHGYLKTILHGRHAP